MSRTRARVGREARACAARTAVKALYAAPCVRVCVVCFATRAGAVGATRAYHYSLQETLYSVEARATYIRTGRVCEFDR